MDITFLYILFFTIIGGILSLAGGFILLWKQKLAKSFSLHFTSFAAGVLLATAFLDLLPEAQEAASDNHFLQPVLFGIIFLFIIERFILWFHHHHEVPEEFAKPTTALITIGDSFHNLIDGVAIASTFFVSAELGILTALAVAAHELPQEIGDFAVMLNSGVKRNKVLLLNIVSSLASVVGAVLTYLAKDLIEPHLYWVLAFTAGMFIYIACADLIPELHASTKQDKGWHQAFLFLFGIIVVYVFIQLLAGYA
jgi:zinc and cadmium transporter